MFGIKPCCTLIQLCWEIKNWVKTVFMPRQCHHNGTLSQAHKIFADTSLRTVINYLRIVWAVIVLLGLCCTVHYVLQNWKRFLLFDSIVVQRSFDYYASKQHNLSTMYPIIVVCANSMHSKDKLLHYENGLINTSLIEAFYGNELYLPFLVSTL